MALDDAARGPVLTDHQRPHDGSWCGPAELPCHNCTDTRLGIEPMQQVLQVPETTLYLDDEKTARAAVPSHEITATSITKVVEGHFGLHDPASICEAPRRGFLEMGVCAVDEPIEIRALPSDFDDQRRVQRVDQLREGAHGQTVELATLCTGTASRESPARAPRSCWRQRRRTRSLRMARGTLVRMAR